MGSAFSTQEATKRPPAKQAAKVAPFLRANHRYSIVQTGDKPNPSGAQLAAATFLAVEPVSLLFELWDLLSQRTTIEVRDNESIDEIVATSWQDYLGVLDRADAYVNFFDDEVVHYYYSIDKAVKEYLAKPQIQAGLLARDAWPLRQLALGLEMESQELVTEGLAGACAFWTSDLEGQLNGPTLGDGEHQGDMSSSCDAIISRELKENAAACDAAHLQELVNLQSLAVIWRFLPKEAAVKLTSAVRRRMQKASGPVKVGRKDAERQWQEIVELALREKPETLEALRLLHDHVQDDPDYLIASRLVSTS